jgi:uncharacterized repeat protein (TIGR03803 family)
MSNRLSKNAMVLLNGRHYAPAWSAMIPDTATRQKAGPTRNKRFIKMGFKIISLLFGLILALGLLPTVPLSAQTFAALHSFIGNDGANPTAGLLLSGNTLYGTCSAGGDFGDGAVFALNNDATGFTTLYSFTFGGDGGFPGGGLLLLSNTLYGTASVGGDFGAGTIFTLNTDGTGFAVLYSFTGGSDGSTPYSGLILSSNTLYGTASTGGTFDNGTVFSLNTDGTSFAILHSFAATFGPFPSTNSDGAAPQAGLLLLGSSLFGTAASGASEGFGTVFTVNSDGTGFKTLHDFSGSADGGNPYAGLVSEGNTLYGATSSGGSLDHGTAFKINADGTGFATLYNFTGANDGANPKGGLILSNKTLYGTAGAGGGSGNGTVFALGTDGTGFTNLHSFTSTSGSVSTNSDGAGPSAALVFSGETLYGTSQNGGSSGKGTVFRLSLGVSQPQLTIIRFQTNLVLTWPTNAVGFIVQSATNFVAPVTWTNVSSSPVIVNGRNTLTNTISGPQHFYRLSQ